MRRIRNHAPRRNPHLFRFCIPLYGALLVTATTFPEALKQLTDHFVACGIASDRIPSITEGMVVQHEPCSPMDRIRRQIA